MSTPQSGTESDFDSGIIRVEARIHIVREKDHHSHSLATKDTSIQNILLGTAESYICFIVFVSLSFFFKFVNSTILDLCQKHFASYNFLLNVIHFCLLILSKVVPFIITISVFLNCYNLSFKQFKKQKMWHLFSRFHYLISFGFLQLFLMIVHRVYMDGPMLIFHIDHFNYETFGHDFATFINTVVLLPICEEFLFRGLLLSILEFRISSKYIVAFINSSLFSMCHLFNLLSSTASVNSVAYQCIAAFIIGYFYCLFMFKNVSLYFLILLHVFHNLSIIMYNQAKISPTLDIIINVVTLSYYVISTYCLYYTDPEKAKKM